MLSPRQFLDKISTDKAIVLNDDTTHNVGVNSKALSLSGITEDTIDPQGGTFSRNPSTGRFIGIVLESVAKLILNKVPELSDEQYQKAIKFVIKTAHSFGVTGMKDAGSPIKAMAAYHELDRQGSFNLYMGTSIRSPDGHREKPLNYGRIEKLSKQYKNKNVLTKFVKIFMDGVPTSSYTAATLTTDLIELDKALQ